MAKAKTRHAKSTAKKTRKRAPKSVSPRNEQKPFSLSEGFARYGFFIRQAISEGYQRLARGNAPLQGERKGQKTPFFNRAEYKKREERGGAYFVAPVSAPAQTAAANVRPSPNAIRAWVAKRKHVSFWRNRDGSYHAIATFYGAKAWDHARRAAEQVPRDAYVSFRYLIKPEFAETLPAKWRSKSPEIEIGAGRRKVELWPQSTPTVRQENWPASYSFVFVAFDPQETEEGLFNAGVYTRRAGLAVLWPGGR